MSRITTAVERIRTTPGLLRDLSAVLVCLVLGISCGVYILAGQSWEKPWEERFTFAADFDKAPAVRPESLQEVRIAGVQVGRITDAEPTEAGTARVTMSIDPDQTVYENARVVIRTKSPLNVMYVTLDPGGPPAAPLERGAVIPVQQTDRAIQPNELLDNLDSRTRSALTSLLEEADVALTDAAVDLGPGLDATRGAMTSFQPVLELLDERREHLASIVSSFAVIAETAGEDDERLASLVASLDDTLAALAARDTELAASLASLPGFTESLGSSMTTVQTLTASLDPTLDDVVAAAAALPQATRELTGTVAAIRRFVAGAAPVIDKAGPVVADLRPVVPQLAAAATSLDTSVTRFLPSATERIVPWMDDLAAFVYQTSSSFSLYDANGGLGRANVTVDLTNPTGGLGDEGIEQEGR
ncbi:MlaD family protein [Nocardioides zeae]|uniref:MCE family protein n=1 Tax=Nocardioides zeae TaxID=1457234 RepID=A0A6P0HGN3_9ACTN|nr:MlaD family protein [Nocardioides zeae]NEN77869.1 MCE family protein [Nocardioides zeae]